MAPTLHLVPDLSTQLAPPQVLANGDRIKFADDAPQATYVSSSGTGVASIPQGDGRPSLCYVDYGEWENFDTNLGYQTLYCRLPSHLNCSVTSEYLESGYRQRTLTCDGVEYSYTEGRGHQNFDTQGDGIEPEQYYVNVGMCNSKDNTFVVNRGKDSFTCKSKKK